MAFVLLSIGVLYPSWTWWQAIAAVALSEVALSVPEIMAAGIFVGAVTFLLGATRLINVVNRYNHTFIPVCTVPPVAPTTIANNLSPGKAHAWKATTQCAQCFTGREP